MALVTVIDEAPRRFDRVLLSRGPIAAGWSTIAALSSSEALLSSWCARERTLHPGMDAKTQAAFSIGRFALAFCYAVAIPALAAGETVDASPDRIGVALVDEMNQHGTGTVPGLRFSICIADPVLSAGRVGTCDRTLDPAALDAMHCMIVDGHSAIVAQLNSMTGLSTGALWRLVADMTCYAFMKIAAQVGRDAFGRKIGTALTTRPGSPLNNRKSGYEYIETDGEGVWFLRRGGCCRAYTLPSERYCPSCVLHPADVRHAIAAQTMREARAAAG